MRAASVVLQGRSRAADPPVVNEPESTYHAVGLGGTSSVTTASDLVHDALRPTIVRGPRAEGSPDARRRPSAVRAS